MENDVAELKAAVASLQQEVTHLNDQAEVAKLQYKYGYYLDKCLYLEVVDLFASHPGTFVEFLGGRYLRKEGARRLYIDRFSTRFVNGRNGPIHGYLLDHPQMQPIVDISADGTRAYGRFRTLMSAGVHKSIAETHPRGLCQWWEGGLYENEYIKEDGVWKIFHLRYFPFWHGDFKEGWASTKPNFVPFDTKTFPEVPNGPDEICEQKMLWPDTRVVPFHYKHPVTGKQVEDNHLRAPEWDGDLSKALPPLMLS